MHRLLLSLNPAGVNELVESLSEGLLVYNAAGEVLMANAAACRLLRRTREQLLASTPEQLAGVMLRPDGGAFPLSLMPGSLVMAGAQTAGPCVMGVRREPSRAPQWLSVTATAVMRGEERLAAVSLSNAISPLGFSFRELVEHSQDAVVVTNAQIEGGGPFIVYVNAAFTALTGYTAQEVIGRSPRLLQGPGTSEAARAEIRAALAEQREVRTTLLNYRRDGEPYWIELQLVPLRDEFGRVTHFAAIERDVTDAQISLEAARAQAQSDPLTGLLNRRGLSQQVGLMSAQAARDGAPLAVIALDIDHFKRINDTHGHPVGDQVLRSVAQELQRRVRQSDLLARVGGEEFVCLVRLKAAHELQELAETLRQTVGALRLPPPLEAAVTVSVGAAWLLGPQDLQGALRRADAALYAAKAAGRNTVQLDAERPAGL